MNNLGINWFDLFVLVMLVVGIFVGRKRGMSLELLSVLQWLMIVFVAAITCEPFGKMLADLSGISPVLTYTAAYLLAAILIKIVFIMIRRMAGEKLVASDVFGNFEYYLGMTAGLIRFACITLFVMALLNAQSVKPMAALMTIKAMRVVFFTDRPDFLRRVQGVEPRGRS